MAFDAHTNLAIAAVVTPPTPATSGTTLIVSAGLGAVFPAVPFNATVWPASANPTKANAEIIRVFFYNGTDGFAIERAQEGTTARAIVAGDLMAATITAKTLTDVEQALTAQGAWADMPFSADNFAGGAGPGFWTVSAGAVRVNRYTVIGKTLMWQLHVASFFGTSVIGAATARLYVKPPIMPLLVDVAVVNPAITLLEAGGSLTAPAAAYSTIVNGWASFAKYAGTDFPLGNIDVVALMIWQLP